MKSMKARRILSNTLIYVILIIMSLIWIAPIVWLLLQSFGKNIGSRANFWPAEGQWTINNYLYLFGNWTGKVHSFETHDFDGLFPIWFLNTFIVATITCVISTLLVLCTAYGLSRFRFKGRNGFMKVNLVIGMFPGFLNLIIFYWVMSYFKMTGSYWTLILIYSAGAGGGYYISKGFFDTISKSIDEAAMIDGASKAQIFWSIILPLAKPIVIYTILTAFLGPWGDYITSSYLIGVDRYQWTVAIGLFQMLQGNGAEVSYFNQFCAGSIIVAIPITALFLSMQKYYVAGVTGGAVKG